MDAIYQEQILSLARLARANEPLVDYSHTAFLSNPTCGDQVDVRLAVAQAGLTAASIEVRGCAICEAGAGLFLEVFENRLPADIPLLRDAFHAWLRGDDNARIDQKMRVFEPVKAIRGRHKCATLAFEAATAALKQENN